MKEGSMTISRKNKSKPIAKIVAFIILLIVCALWILPLIFMVGTSFKDEADLLTNPTTLFPSIDHWTIDNYTGFLIRDGHIDNMPLWMMNSFIIAIAKVVLTLVLDCLAAYAFVFLRFVGKKTVYSFLIISMTIPGVIATTAMFAMYATSAKTLNLVDSQVFTYIWLIIPGLSGVYNLLLMRNFFNSIPHDIVESARMDGASNLRIFWTNILPLARSTILIIVLFTFVGSWNDLFWPQLLLSGHGQSWETVTVALAGFAQGDDLSNMGVNMATATFSLIPIMIVFFVAQNKMIEGLSTTGMKN